MPTLTPAMRTTAAAAAAGAQEWLKNPRRGRGSRASCGSLTTRYATCSTVVRPRRLGREPVQRLSQPLFLVVHDATSPLMSSARPGASLSRASALAAWDFTAPTEQPIAAAVWASVWSAK